MRGTKFFEVTKDKRIKNETHVQNHCRRPQNFLFFRAQISLPTSKDQEILFLLLLLLSQSNSLYAHCQNKTDLNDIVLWYSTRCSKILRVKEGNWIINLDYQVTKNLRYLMIISQSFGLTCERMISSNYCTHTLDL